MEDGPYLGPVVVGMVGMFLFPFALLCLGLCEKAFRDYRWLKRRNDGIKASIFGLLLLAQISLFAYTWWSADEDQRRRTAPIECMSNIKQIGLGFEQYVQDNDSTTPPASHWADDIVPYTKGPVFHCPISPTPYGYADNVALDTKQMEKLAHPDTTVLIFESDRNDRNACGTVRDLTPNRHGWRGSNYGFVDGHVKQLKPDSLSTVKWNP